MSGKINETQDKKQISLIQNDKNSNFMKMLSDGLNKINFLKILNQDGKMLEFSFEKPVLI